MHRRDRAHPDSALLSELRWKGFTFVSQKQQRPRDSTTLSPSLPEDRNPIQRRVLSQTQVGDRVHLTTLHQFASILAAKGLASGMVVQIVSRTDSGSVIVSFQGRTLGIGSTIAQAIVVEPI